MVLGNLTDLCLNWTWFLMISGNPSSNCQIVWLKIRQTFDTSICTELKGFVSYGVCCRLLVFSCAGPGIFVQKSSCLQGSGRRIQHFPGGPLANFYGNLTSDFQEDGSPDPCLNSDPHMLLLKNFLRIPTYFSLCVKLYTVRT